ncbi:MAG: outer membrane lipoprotein carrier protein LolA [Acidobacteriota bacterium]|nr:outer membrane lipoprotein carrier protein LolA [Acidobacteriota bacterium]
MFRRAVLTLVCVVSAWAQAPADLAAAFARLDKTAGQFKSVEANINRNVHTAVINDDAKDAGILRARRGKSHDIRMLIDFMAPDAKAVSIEGARVSIYYPKLRTVQEYDIGAKRDLVEQFLLLGFGASSAELKEHYDITLIGREQVGAENAWHLLLVPKSAEALKNLKKAELWIAESTGLPVQQKFVTSAGGDYTQVTYSNMQPNKPLPDGVLKLSYPKGVAVEHPKL